MLETEDPELRRVLRELPNPYGLTIDEVEDLLSLARSLRVRHGPGTPEHEALTRAETQFFHSLHGRGLDFIRQMTPRVLALRERRRATCQYIDSARLEELRRIFDVARRESLFAVERVFVMAGADADPSIREDVDRFNDDIFEEILRRRDAREKLTDYEFWLLAFMTPEEIREEFGLTAESPNREEKS